MDELARAAAALGDGDRLGALDRLLAAWGATRSARVADLIDELCAPFDRAYGRRPLTREAWIDLAARPRAALLGRLVADFPHLASTLVDARLERIESWPDDPRLARVLTDIALAVPWTGNQSHRLWRRLFRLLVRLRDPRSAVRLDGASPGRLPRGGEVFRQIYTAGLRAVHAAVARPPALDDAALAPLHALVAAQRDAPVPAFEEVIASYDARLPVAPSGGATEADLILRIADDPAADGPRHILADYYLERGDPRGELMALQLAPALGRSQQARLRRLLRDQRDAMLGPLVHVVDKASLRFERGALAECAARFRSRNERAAAIGDPRWATVRELEADDAELAGHPVMRSLRVLRGMRVAQLAELCGGREPLPITELGLVIADSSIGTAAELAAIGGARRLPHLRTLRIELGERFRGSTVDAHQLAWLLEHAICEPVTALAIRGPYSTAYRLASFLPRLGALPRIELGPSFALVRAGAVDELHLGMPMLWNGAMLEAQLATVTALELVVDVPADFRQHVAAHLAAVGRFAIRWRQDKS